MPHAVPDFRALFDAIPAPYLAIRPDFTIVAVNDAYLRAVMRERDSVLGRDLFEAFPDNPDDASASGVANLRASLLRVLATAAPDIMAVQKYDIPLAPELDGGFEERYWSPVNTPVFDAAGAVTHIIHRVDDITDFARAQAEIAAEARLAALAMRDSEAKFRTIADAMPQMVWSTLPDGYHDYFNQQWYDFTGMPEGSTDGEEWNGMFHPDDQPRAWRAWEHSLASGAIYEIQYRLRHRSGSYRWVLGRALPVRDPAGAIIRWMGTCTDIDDQKLAEDELRLASSRKDEFLAMLAHELRNPLAPISSAAQLLKLQQGGDPRVQKASDIIIRQVSHLTELIDDLLDVSRVTRGLVALTKVTLDLKSVVHSAVEQARPLIEARRHDLVLRIASARAPVSGDKTRLVQVIANLLNNAAKYTAPGGEITLRLEVEHAQVRLSVADNGTGIAPALLPFVFDLFIQGERTPDRAQGGLGLGLALVKSIAALHDGSVAASSDGVGKGSTFALTLPLAQDRGTELAPSAAAPAALGTAPVRVMIVDDNIDAAQSLAALLAADGHQVMVAEDGEGALKAAEGAAIEVFILDIGLPDMDGYELARRLKADPANAAAVLIALTGYGQAQDRAQSKAAGFDHHFVKPVDFEALSKLLKAAH